MSNNFDRLPEEAKGFAQWIAWKYEHRGGDKPTKVPVNPNTGYNASVTNPATWGTFAAAVASTVNEGIAGIGFVFADSDPFTGVDLDVAPGASPNEFQTFAYNKLDTYAEISPSGRGVHLIVRGSVPEGVNNQRLGIEVYSSGRFFTCTGNVVNDKPIADRHDMINELYDEISANEVSAAGPLEIKNPTQPISDERLVEKLTRGNANRGYYEYTNVGNWSDAYHSVLRGLCYLCSDEDQVQRVILASPLVTQTPAHSSGPRPKRVARLWAKEYIKAARTGDLERGDMPYRSWSLHIVPGGSREQHAEFVAHGKAIALHLIEQHRQAVKEVAHRAHALIRQATTPVGGDKLPVPLKVAGLTTYDDLTTTPPPGNFYDMVQEICARSRNPSEVMAEWAVLGYVSGTVGRSYVSEDGSGVNNFLILVAGTNTGKTQHWSAMSDIGRHSAPGIGDRVFGGDIASAQRIASEGQSKASMTLRLPDAGDWLRQVIEGKTAITAQLRSALLNIYESAGDGRAWDTPKSQAAKADKVQSIYEFNMSLTLDTTPQYAEDFDLSDFTDGLMSRFILVYGPSVISELQEPKTGHDLPPSILNTMGQLQSVIGHHTKPSEPDKQLGIGVPQRIVVRYADDVRSYLWALEKEINDFTRIVQQRKRPPHYIAASRVVLNAKRVAYTVAIIECPHTPVVTRSIMDWALRFVLSSVTAVIKQFDDGTIGSDESKQEAAIVDVIARAIDQHPDRPYITMSELCKTVDRLVCFTKSKLGARTTRQRVVFDMLDRGVLDKITITTKTKPTVGVTFGQSYVDQTQS